MRARLRLSYPVVRGLNNHGVSKAGGYVRSLSSVAIACAG
jgi:hypothetical protein